MRILLTLMFLSAPVWAGEAEAARAFEAAKADPPSLYAFLLRMPKGADLHNHLAGAIYAESFIQQAAQDRDCLELKDPRIIAGSCGEDSRPAAAALTDDDFYSRAIDSLSMRDFVPGHEPPQDHFFDTFGKFGPVSHTHETDGLIEVVKRADAQNESYLELMALSTASEIAKLSGPAWSDDFANLSNAWMHSGMDEAAASVSRHVDELEAALKQIPHHVQVRYIIQVLRNNPQESVFAQTLAGFLAASKDPRIVAVNLVQPEHGYYSMRDYSLHMRMVSFMRQRFPNVHVTLHAGELALGLVPPEGLRFHIREAVEVAHAERIGHGVDIAYEGGSENTLREMAAEHIAVEINLTSNDVILGVRGADHPFTLYRKSGVPITLSTDDEGVSRTHLTEEYWRMIRTYNLRYLEVKQIVHNGIEYSFLNPEDKKRALADLSERWTVFEASFTPKATMKHRNE